MVDGFWPQSIPMKMVTLMTGRRMDSRLRGNDTILGGNDIILGGNDRVVDGFPPPRE